MTMLSFRTDDDTAARATEWARRLGVGRSELLRSALRQYLARLGADDDARAWLDVPLSPDESSLGDIADWGPAEDWSDWAHDAEG